MDSPKSDLGTASKLSDSELLKALLDEVPDYVYFKDMASQFIRTSKSHASHMGAEKQEDMIGKSDFDYFSYDSATARLEDEGRLLNSESSLVYKEEEGVMMDGEAIWVLTSKNPMRNKDGKIVGTIGVSRNITQYKRDQIRLAEAQERLIEMSRHVGRSEIAASILHNVGNVLNSINLSSSLVIERAVESDSEMLGKIAALVDKSPVDLAKYLTEDEKGKQIPALLKELSASLDHERRETISEMGKLREYLEHTKMIIASQQELARSGSFDTNASVNQVIETAITVNIASINRHGVKIVRDFEEMPTLVFDKHRLLQVLINLVSNAKYACDKKEVIDPMIEIHSSFDGDSVRIEVKDNGSGIEIGDLDHIFEYGFTRREEGNGIGLHSSVIALQDMNGSINAESEGLGKGARFSVSFPVTRLEE